MSEQRTSAIVSWEAGRLDVFRRGIDGKMYHKYFQNGWGEDRKFVPTSVGCTKGIGGGDAFMKLCLPSSGCKSRPAKGEPARAGSKPCADARNGMGDA